MPDNQSLEELFRAHVTFPSGGAAIADLQKALPHLEDELERSSAQIAVRLRARHALERDKLHPEDKQYEEGELEHSVNVLLPRVVRGGFILTLWSTFEVAAEDLAQYASRELGKPLDSKRFQHGNIVDNLRKAFTKDLGILAFPDNDIHDDLCDLKDFRDALIHKAGKVTKLPRRLQRDTASEFAAIGLHCYEDMRHKYVVPKAEFVRQALELVSNYMSNLSDRVYAVVHPTPLTDQS